MGQRWRVRRFNNIKTLLCQAHGGGARFHFIMDDVGDARVMQEATSEQIWRGQSP